MKKTHTIYGIPCDDCEKVYIGQPFYTSILEIPYKKL